MLPHGPFKRKRDESMEKHHHAKAKETPAKHEPVGTRNPLRIEAATEAPHSGASAKLTAANISMTDIIVLAEELFAVAPEAGPIFKDIVQTVRSKPVNWAHVAELLQKLVLLGQSREPVVP